MQPLFTCYQPRADCSAQTLTQTTLFGGTLPHNRCPSGSTGHLTQRRRVFNFERSSKHWRTIRNVDREFAFHRGGRQSKWRRAPLVPTLLVRTFPLPPSFHSSHFPLPLPFNTHSCEQATQQQRDAIGPTTCQGGGLHPARRDTGQVPAWLWPTRPRHGVPSLRRTSRHVGPGLHATTAITTAPRQTPLIPARPGCVRRAPHGRR